MKKIFLILCLSMSLFALENAKIILESIVEDAIIIGTGEESKSFIFLDPLCPFSRGYLSMISKNEALLKKTTYYVFLYKLPKIDSARLIQHIYESKNPLETMKKVMLKEEKVSFKKTTKTGKALEMIDDVSSVAKKLNVTVRPYQIRYMKGSDYCDVSHGDAPCESECIH